MLKNTQTIITDSRRNRKSEQIGRDLSMRNKTNKQTNKQKTTHKVKPWTK